MKEPKCKTCAYWQALDADADEGDDWRPPYEGVCGRFPHQYVGLRRGDSASDHTITMDAWQQPVTDLHSSCGEHPDYPAYLAWLREQAVARVDPPAEAKETR